MLLYWLWGLVVVAVVAIVISIAYGYWRKRRHDLKLDQVRKMFFLRREWLEAEFHKTAGSQGKPRGLRWVDCDFADPVAFARDRRTGDLTALVAVGIRFAAVEGGGMEEVEAVSNVKAATAVFRFKDQHWTTEGRAIFNLNPEEAIEFYRSELEVVE